ncbi:uncharacterized protein RCC_01562 [Ramularia collo-cygni]|uniref:Secreted protein n=1 Tax=Ramularia collo-cygni TaxID=112498 RepID=A0A2D3UPD4_9PEZI|nr:uncharacterized protein RCC_01562 [Ramularia collo-cygni]CZT15728.1 uncharacterized protein RCC_01562 [Ramularia collo-cygni]
MRVQSLLTLSGLWMGLGAAASESTPISSAPAPLFGRQVGVPPLCSVIPARWIHLVKAVAQLERRAAVMMKRTIALVVLARLVDPVEQVPTEGLNFGCSHLASP